MRRTLEDGRDPFGADRAKAVTTTAEFLQERPELVGGEGTVDREGQRIDDRSAAALVPTTFEKARPIAVRRRAQEQAGVPQRARPAQAAIDVGGDAQQDLHQQVLVGGDRVALSIEVLEATLAKDLARGKAKPGQPPEGPVQVDGEAVLPGALERMRDTHRQAARADRECGSAHAQVAQDSTGTRDVRLANEQVEVPGEPMAHAAVKSSRHGQALQQQVLEAGAPEGRIDLGEGTLESGIPLLLSLPLVAQALECGRGPERAECVVAKA